ERPEPDLPPAVIDLERDDRVAERDLRGPVQDEVDDVRDHEWDPEGGREIVQPADRAIRRQEVEHRRAECFAGDYRDADRGEGGEAGGAGREPEGQVVHATNYARAIATGAGEPLERCVGRVSS